MVIKQRKKIFLKSIIVFQVISIVGEMRKKHIRKLLFQVIQKCR